ncbi:uncharacterized protein LOC115627404 [Scaptodrosophila lebanonensis]|uniref:Uncharacterized protein LOC115627404 n=1 Tax=Drosophila lebanonensis TaxID=7225 RepID=A0A6J2TUT8_DROLE|nr:uncharacterized protein LOC115627404 [Scaptodrosophila lebanonensis]
MMMFSSRGSSSSSSSSKNNNNNNNNSNSNSDNNSSVPPGLGPSLSLSLSISRSGSLSCWLLMLLIVGEAVYAAGDAANATHRLTRTEEAKTHLVAIAARKFLTITMQQPNDAQTNRHHQPLVESSSNNNNNHSITTAATETATLPSSSTNGSSSKDSLTTAFAITHNGFPYEQPHALTISRPPFASRRYRRNVEEDQVDRCRLFVEGDPTKNELYSPEYPNLYPKNINCTRVITAPKGQIIRLDFRNSFNIEAKEECKFDFLEIRDGQYGFSTLIGKYCGTDFPPEITSKERYLWLHFHSDETIEYNGFSAVFEFLDRNREAPSTDLNCTIEKDGYEGFINSTDVPADIRDQVIRNKIALDCIWRIQVQENWKIQLKFLDFHLSKPNDCETNFLDIFPEQTVMPLRVKNFCGSAGESITAESNILHMRFYAEQIAINSTFAILYTAFRDRGTAACTEEEYDCEDATCISKDLRCNFRDNCKFRWDEESCPTVSASQSDHVVIIIVVFGLILGGMILTFIVNCIRKIIRDQKIIREHIRESKESKLDEMGRNSKARSRENISRQKHSQTSLQILDDVSNHFYREPVPISTQSSKADFKEKEHSILRRHNDMTQTSLCGGMGGPDDGESSSTTTATHEILATGPTAAAIRGVVNACDMGCQTRESLFANSPSAVATLMRQKSSSSSLGATSATGGGGGGGGGTLPPPPPRFFSTFGYEQGGPPSPAVPPPPPAASAMLLNTLSRRSMHTPPQQHESLELEERHSHSGHSGPRSHYGLIVASTVNKPQEMCHHHHQHQQQHQHQQLQQQQRGRGLHSHDEQQHQQQPPASAVMTAAQHQHTHGHAHLAPGGTAIQQQTMPAKGNPVPGKQQKNEESKVFIDIRNSAPDVIIMTSH